MDSSILQLIQSLQANLLGGPQVSSNFDRGLTSRPMTGQRIMQQLGQGEALSSINMSMSPRRSGVLGSGLLGAGLNLGSLFLPGSLLGRRSSNPFDPSNLQTQLNLVAPGKFLAGATFL